MDLPPPNTLVGAGLTDDSQTALGEDTLNSTRSSSIGGSITHPTLWIYGTARSTHAQQREWDEFVV